MAETEQALVVTVDCKELVVPMPTKTSRIATPVVPNRAARRRMQRARGDRGTKAKRVRRDLADQVIESEQQRAAREAHEAQTKVIESAQHIRAMTGGGFWLPGQQ